MTALRQEYPVRIIELRTPMQIQAAITTLQNAPVDFDKPLQFSLGEKSKPRKPDQNALMWAGVLQDISEQAYINGRTYSDKVWHEQFKEMFLPDETLMSPEDIAKYLRKGYKKYDYDLKGNRLLIGSTTELTVKGFAIYLTKLEAFATSTLGVQLHANPNEFREFA